MSAFVDIWMTVPEAEFDWAAEVLCELGSAGVVESAAPDGLVQVLGSVPADRGGEALSGLEETVSRALALGQIGRSPSIGTAPSATIDWQAVLRQHHQPLRVGGVWVRPPWVEPTGDPEIVLEPGMAFGTGSHETTRLCLIAVVAALDAHPVKSLLDVGTGSGILALVALRHRPELSAVACDVDPDAIDSAREAARRNRLEDRLDLRVGGLQPAWGQFDLVVANLQWNVFRTETSKIAAAVRPGGLLLTSGLLLDQAAPMIELARISGLHLQQQQQNGEWCLLAFSRASASSP